MRLQEFSNLSPLNEYGARSHPGYGRKCFTAGAYGYIASAISDVRDPAIKEFLSHWFAEIFAADNSSFKAEQFEKAALSSHYNSRYNTPTFQSRHFYYLAGEIKKIPDEHAREFCMNFVGEVVSRTNHEFKPDRWRKFCGFDAPPEPKQRRSGYRAQPKQALAQNTALDIDD